MTAIELAAIASAAVPGLNVTAFGPEPDDAADFSSALLVDAENRRWRVRSPRHAEASARLETERQVLRAFSPAIRAELPFLLPTVAGTVRQGELITFVYSHIIGKPESVEALASGGAALALEIGAAIAAIHDLPQELVTRADLPSYSANEFRQRKLNELDQAATTGKIPPSLLRRWEHAMEDVALWRFNASVVHGDLHEDNILLDGPRVTAVMGWTDLRVGDPADDFAWLVAINDPKFVDAVLQAYTAARHETPDPHLLRRAALSAEFALAQWLVKGVAADSARMVADAQEMLATLKADIDEHGGQPISTEPAPGAVAPTAAPMAGADAAEAGEAPASDAPAGPDEAATGSIPVIATPAATDDAGDATGTIPVVTKPAATDDAGDSPDGEPETAVEPAPDGEPKAGAAANPGDDDPAAGSPEDVDTTALKVIPLRTPPAG
ncbi:macrolide 2'-phosphotransferase [Arthrobacter sp. SDTb3-6]|uniref:phosphotransferase n=1 Tax=Arthrobacter sp. SDTb3-6 TaxID=2713571 RepID=UPI00159DB6CA|nr:macrolide 2'-phosphotransferase [Arthrobacter sp. SDTb3-6]NVM97567.1 phosphotransferase [Arthrobacter sp. SDTb3-6]